MITTNTQTNPTTNQVLTKAIDIKTKAVNKHRHDYISKTSDLIESKYKFSVVKASKQVQIIYDVIVKQLVSKAMNGLGGNTFYEISTAGKYSKKYFYDIRISVKGKPISAWSLMQELNPLLIKTYEGNQYEAGECVINKDFDSVIKNIVQYNGAYLVNLIEGQRKLTTIKTKATKKKKGSVKQVLIKGKVDKIKINAESLQDFINETTHAMLSANDDAYAELKKVKAISKQLLLINSVNDYVPLMIKFSHSGRKYYRGSKHTNLQQMKKVIRTACFKGCTEIDINACSAQFLIQQAKQYGCSSKTLRQLKANSFKKKIRYDVAKHVYGVATEETIKGAKEIITAIGLGGSLTSLSHKHNKLLSRGTVTVEQLKKAQLHSFVRPYYNEVRAINQSIFDGNQHLVGKDFLHKDKDIKQPLQKGKVSTYLYQKFEAESMKTALKGFKDNIRLQVHDGVYLENLTITEINKIKLRFSKMDLTITVKQL